jgi:hypothetical protein
VGRTARGASGRGARRVYLCGPCLACLACSGLPISYRSAGACAARGCRNQTRPVGRMLHAHGLVGVDAICVVMYDSSYDVGKEKEQVR